MWNIEFVKGSGNWTNREFKKNKCHKWKNWKGTLYITPTFVRIEANIESCSPNEASFRLVTPRVRFTPPLNDVSIKISISELHQRKVTLNMAKI